MHRRVSKNGKTLRRRLPAAFAALWVCLGLQPCALAAASDGDCPHGAGAAAHAMPAGHGDGHTHGQGPDCDTSATSCCNADSSAATARTPATKADDGGEVDASPVPQGFDFALRPPEPPERHAKPPLPPDRARPLHVLNCVYLD